MVNSSSYEVQVHISLEMLMLSCPSGVLFFVLLLLGLWFIKRKRPDSLENTSIHGPRSHWMLSGSRKITAVGSSTPHYEVESGPKHEYSRAQIKYQMTVDVAKFKACMRNFQVILKNLISGYMPDHNA